MACSAAEHAHWVTGAGGGRQRVGEDLGASLGNLVLVGVGGATRARVDDGVAVTEVSKKDCVSNAHGPSSAFLSCVGYIRG